MARTIAEKAISEECGDGDADGNDGEDGATCLGELVGELPPLELGPWSALIEGRMPGFREVAEALIVDILMTEGRLGLVRNEVADINWDFDWMPDDYRCMQRVAVKELDGATELLYEVKVALLRWFKAFQESRIIQIDEKSWPALQQLIASSIPWARGHAAALVVQSAVGHLLKQPNAAHIIAQSEQRRFEAFDAEHGGKPGDRNRTAWPWRDLSGKPWPAAEHKDDGSTAKGRRPSRGANSTTAKRVQHGGRKGKAA